MTPNLDFKVMIFFNVNYRETSTRQSYTYNGRLILIYRMVPLSVTLNDP